VITIEPDDEDVIDADDDEDTDESTRVEPPRLGSKKYRIDRRMYRKASMLPKRRVRPRLSLLDAVAPAAGVALAYLVAMRQAQVCGVVSWGTFDPCATRYTLALSLTVLLAYGPRILTPWWRRRQ
jgi:hypothetical protein